MTIVQTSRLLFILTATAFLSACQSTGSGNSAAAGGGTASVELPKDFGERAAAHIVSDYVRDATGPAEIEFQPQSGGGLLREATSVTVRYPVRTHSLGQRLIAKDWLLDRMEKTETGMRCITVAAVRERGNDTETRFVISRRKVDEASCGEGKTYVPYLQLERMAASLKACREKGEERCLLFSSLPPKPRSR